MYLFVDLSDVLIHGMYDMDDVVHYRFGSEIAQKFRERHEDPEVWNTLQDLFRGRMTEEEYWKYFIGNEYWPEYVTPKIFEFALESNLKKRVTGTADILSNIKGYTMNGVVTNSIPIMVLVSDHIKERIPEIMRNHPDILGLFDYTYWSCDLGMIKQDPDYFNHICNLVDTRPCEVTYIDDCEGNLEAAKMAGIKDTILFQNPARLQTALESRGFIFANAKQQQNKDLKFATA